MGKQVLEFFVLLDTCQRKNRKPSGSSVSLEVSIFFVRYGSYFLRCFYYLSIWCISNVFFLGNFVIEQQKIRIAIRECFPVLRTKTVDRRMRDKRNDFFEIEIC